MRNRRSYAFSLVSALADRAFIDASVHTERRGRFRATERSLRIDAATSAASAGASVSTTGGRSS
ncbi:MAG TPA: hypothetical protein VNO30_25885 [Kofleriaceae bacterium]|nr:hypothetical protein [Kofleriaceae bacterium]